MGLKEVSDEITTAFPESPESQALKEGDNERALDLLRRRAISDTHVEPNTAGKLHSKLLILVRTSNK